MVLFLRLPPCCQEEVTRQVLITPAMAATARATPPWYSSNSDRRTEHNHRSGVYARSKRKSDSIHRRPIWREYRLPERECCREVGPRRGHWQCESDADLERHDYTFSGQSICVERRSSTLIPFPGNNYFAYAPGTYTMAGTYSGDSSFKTSSSLELPSLLRRPRATSRPTS